MAISSLLVTPEFGTVGQPVKLTVSGEPSGETRFYLRSAPATSTLDTLETFEARYKKREQIRLAKDGPSASFTPDVPGRYEAVVYDVAVLKPAPHFGGQVVAEPSDNELDLSGVSLVFYVVESRSRTIGTAQDTATLTVRGYNNAIVPERPIGTEQASLSGLNSAPAKLAASDADVLTALVAIRESSDVQTNLNLSAAFIQAAVEGWNNHVGQDNTGWTVHGAADGTNVASVAATTYNEALSLLNNLKSRLNTHRVLTAGSVHAAADNTNVVTAAGASDTASAIALWVDIRDRLWAHMVRSASHSGSSGPPEDGAAFSWLEPPSGTGNMIGKVNALRTVYETHRQKTTNASGVHAVADAENVVLLSLGSLDGLLATVNAWADAIERHSANRGVTSALLDPAPHDTSKPLRVPLRASDLATAIRTAELCCIAFEMHATNAGADQAHANPAFGAHGFTITERYCLRLARAWHYATRGLQAPTATGVNSGFASLVALGGWT